VCQIETEGRLSTVLRVTQMAHRVRCSCIRDRLFRQEANRDVYPTRGAPVMKCDSRIWGTARTFGEIDEAGD
jgi:hypothetical protein